MNDNDLIQKFFEGSLSKEELELFQARLKDKEFNKEFKSQFKLISSLEIIEDQQKEKKYFINPIRLAASIIIILGIGTIIYFLTIRPIAIKNQIVTSDTIKQDKIIDTTKKVNYQKDEAVNLYAENFVPNLTIEGLIESNSFRDIKETSYKISPEDSSIFNINKTIPFLISISEDISLLEVVIYNNHGSEINKFTLNNHEKKEIKLELNPGIYYWKINYNGNSKWGGKFYINN